MPSIVRFGSRERTHDEVKARARRAAAGFSGLGVGPGDVVATILRNDTPFLEATLAAGYLGAYLTPLNWHATADEAAYILADCDPNAVVIHADLLPRYEEQLAGRKVFVVEPPAELLNVYGLSPAGSGWEGAHQAWDAFIESNADIEPAPVEAPGAMIYTSGTTGHPKGVRRAPPTAEEAARLREVVGALFGTADANPSQLVALAAAPLYHSTPNAWTPHFFNIGATLIIHDRFDAESMLREIERSRVTHLLAVPTMFVRLLKLPADVRSRYDVSSLRFVMHGAAPCPPDIKRAMIEWWGPVIWEHYGGTETGAVTLCDSREWLANPGTVGRAFLDSELAILDEQGKPVPPRVIGEVACRRFTVADFTYNKDPGKREKADRDGLVSLGDHGYLNDDGFLFLSGRSAEVVISGGVNIYPAEIEAELIKMSGVADCAVFGIPDEEFGESLCAFVQPQADANLTADKVREYLRPKVSSYKLPKRVEIRQELPREDSGKIFKRKLREPFWAEAGRAI